MGIGYSLLASALWPMVALIVPLHRQGTAFGKYLITQIKSSNALSRKKFPSILGLMQAVQNAGLAVISLLAGYIVDRFGYIWLEVFFIGWLILALITTVILILTDAWTSGYLNMTSYCRKKYETDQTIS